MANNDNIVVRISWFYWLMCLMGVIIIASIINLQFFAVDEEGVRYSQKPEESGIVKVEVEPHRGAILASGGQILAISKPMYVLSIDFLADGLTDTVFDDNVRRLANCFAEHIKEKSASEYERFLRDARNIALKDKGKRTINRKSDSIFYANVDDMAKSFSSFYGGKTAAEYKKQLIDEHNKLYTTKSNRNKRINDKKIDYLTLQKIEALTIKFREKKDSDKDKNKGDDKKGKESNLKKKKERTISEWLVEEKEMERVNPYQMAQRIIGYENADSTGVGIEKSFTKTLAGKPGIQVKQRISGRGFIPIESDENIAPKDGYDVVSTIDIDIQDAAETALRAQLTLKKDLLEAGTAIVMETRTGEIRAIVNMMRDKKGVFNELLNYGIGAATEPGSTFKLIALMAALETGNINIDDVIDCGTSNVWKSSEFKFTFYESGDHGLGKATVQRIIEKSSNIGTAKMMLKAFGTTNDSKFTDFIYKLKLNEKIGLDVGDEASPKVKNPATTKHWMPYSMPQMALGYELTVTPIQTLSVYNAIANNGRMVKPKFVKEIRDNGDCVQSFDTKTIKESVCSPSTLEKVRQVLEGTVKNGTPASVFRGANYNVAGKTGTAKMAFGNKGYTLNGQKRHQASFCGYFPANNPQFTCIVVLYSGLIKEGKGNNVYGADWAAPVFRKIADKIYATHPACQSYVVVNNDTPFSMPAVKDGKGGEVVKALEQLDIPFKVDKGGAEWVATATDENKKVKVTEQELKKQLVPSVKGMGLKDALYLLEDLGLRVSFSGKGTVLSQSIEAGQRFQKGEKIVLTLGV